VGLLLIMLSYRTSGSLTLLLLSIVRLSLGEHEFLRDFPGLGLHFLGETAGRETCQPLLES
jgi:hypothetical protein